MSDRWISVTEYALKYGLDRSTVTIWARKGKIRAVRKGRNWCLLDPMVLELANPNTRVVTTEDLRPLLRGNEVAEFIGVSDRMLRKYAQAGKVGFRLDGKRRRYSIQDVRDILAVRMYNKNRVPRKDKRMSIMQWARLRLGQPPQTT